MNSLVLCETQQQVTTLTLNRPGRHNSLIPDLLEDLLDGLAQATGSHARAVVLQANGRSFSTGGDVRWFFEHRAEPATAALEIVGLLNRVLLAMIDLAAPIVTCVHGTVTGGSLGLVLASDVVLVSPEATFTPYYGPLGFSPDGGWTALLPALIGAKRAEECLFTNRTIGAAKAVEWGLANRIVPADRIREQVLSTARTIAGMKAGSIERSKRLVWGDRSQIAARLEQERQQFVTQIQSGEAREGMEAFLAGRTR
ncbi:MAG: enoyl-CoA hydratase/isomerase family protein [Rudaea sp.]